MIIIIYKTASLNWRVLSVFRRQLSVLCSKTPWWLCVPGGGPLIGGGDLQAVDERGGGVGPNQGTVGPHRVLAAHLAAGGAGLRDPEEAEPAR